MRRAAFVIGLLAALAGLVFSLQGAGILPGSYMTGDRLWLVIGTRDGGRWRRRGGMGQARDCELSYASWSYASWSSAPALAMAVSARSSSPGFRLTAAIALIRTTVS